MPLSEARSLVEQTRPAAATILEHDPETDRQMLQQLALDCHQFSPTVGLEQAEQPDCLLLDITSVSHLFGGMRSLELRVADHFREAGYLVRTAIAPTIGMAWGLAKYQEQRAKDKGNTNSAVLGAALGAGLPTSPSGPHPPCGHPLPEGEGNTLISSFSSLSVAVLRLQPATLQTLHQLGIERVEQLQCLPRSALHSRFGDELTWRLDQARGVIDEVITAVQPPADFYAEQFLDYPISDRQTMAVVLSRLLGQLCQQMRGRQLGGLVWRCDLRGPHTEPLQMELKLFQPTATLAHLTPLLNMQLEDQFGGHGRPRRRATRGRQHTDGPLQIQELSVSVRHCVLLAERQPQLFDESPHLNRQVLGQLINRLSSRLGAQQVVAPRLHASAQVEQAFRFQPLVGVRRRSSGRAGRSVPLAVSPLQRPLRLCPEPLELSAVSLGGRPPRGSSVPALFMCGRQRLRVARRWGPERIETAWWRGATIRRDYWRIETDDGRWLWVFRNLANRRWYLHGEF